VRTVQAEDALRLVREAIGPARAADELPEFFAELERIRVAILLTPAAAPVTANEVTADHLLTTAQTAKRLGRSEWWVRSNKDTLPIVRLPTGRYRFSANGLDRWLRTRDDRRRLRRFPTGVGDARLLSVAVAAGRPGSWKSTRARK
jgi:hypothetical protein